MQCMQLADIAVTTGKAVTLFYSRDVSYSSVKDQADP